MNRKDCENGQETPESKSLHHPNLVFKYPDQIKGKSFDAEADPKAQRSRISFASDTAQSKPSSNASSSTLYCRVPGCEV
jgi:hypothetical protein